MIILFIILYSIIFVAYAGRYSSIMQDIQKEKLKLSKFKSQREKYEARIKEKSEIIRKLKKQVWIAILLVFVLNLLTLSLSEFADSRDYLFSLFPLGGYSILVLLATWMKGAGTIDQSPKEGRDKTPYL